MNFSLNDPFTLKESTRPYFAHIHKCLVQSDINYAKGVDPDTKVGGGRHTCQPR